MRNSLYVYQIILINKIHFYDGNLYLLFGANLQMVQILLLERTPPGRIVFFRWII